MSADRLRAIADRLRGSTEPVVVLADDLVVHEAALAPVTRDPHAGTALLVRPASSGGNARVRHHMVMSVGSAFHEVSGADAVMVGALVVSAADAEQAGAAVDAMAQALDAGQVHGDAFDLAVVAITRAGIPLRAIDMVDVPWSRAPQDAAAAQAAAQSVSAERIAALQANRIDDGLYSTFVVRRLSKPLTGLALRLGLAPNTITLVSFAVGLAAAVAFGLGSWPWLVAGAVLLQASLVIDCVDGEVARATRRFSALGAWLDASTDRVKEFAAYAGLAVGAARVHEENIWPLAIVLVLLVTTRHMADYDFSRVQRMREARVEPRSILEAQDGGAAAGWSVASTMERSAQLNRRDAVRWAKRAIHLPIGERWLILSLAAAILGARWALLLLLAAALLAFAYVTSGRILRTLTWRGLAPEPAGLLLARQSDAGPIASGLSHGMSAQGWDAFWRGPWAWAVPTGLRFLELGVVAVLVLAVAPSLMVIGFLWMAVVAFHHYDVLYRALNGRGTPRWLIWAGLGWDGRSLLLALATALGLLGVVLPLGLLAWVMLLVVIASAQWLATVGRPA